MIQSVERALDLLLLSAAQPEGVGLRELARRAGLKAATAQHLIQTMAHRGFLEWDDETSTYRPGLLSAAISSQHQRIETWYRWLAPHAEALTQQYGESVDSVAMAGGRLLRIALFRPGESAPRLYGGLEERLPHQMAMGLVLLAASPEPVILAYAEAHGLPDLPGELEATRKKGYADSDDLPDRHNAIGFAMAVKSANGVPLFALNHHAPLARDTKQHRKQLLAGLKNTINQLESSSFPDLTSPTAQ